VAHYPSFSQERERPKEFDMITTLQIECVGGWYLNDKCMRIVEIDDCASLYDLHEVIQDAVEFGRDHPFVFYTANSSSPWAHKNLLAEVDEWGDTFSELYIKDIYPLGRRKLYYLFDFGDKWTFEVRKKRGSKTPEAGVKYPRVIGEFGPNPQQYPSHEE
jgi:hypothetical protein